MARFAYPLIASFVLVFLVGCGADARPPILPELVQPLRISKGGTGTGTVMSSVPGIFCALGCESSDAEFDLGSHVTLMARSGVGSYFAGWEGACAGRGNFCEVSMDEARYARAIFQRRVDRPSCQHDRAVRAFFTRSPVALDHLVETTPLAELVPPEHVLPNPHMFLRAATPGPGEAPAVVYAPGDATIVAMSASWDDSLSKYDYYIRFSPCREVELLIALVHDLTPALAARLGPPTSCAGRDECIWTNLDVRVRAGDEVGRVHGRYHAVALEAYDARQGSLGYANVGRYRAELAYLQCPLDYFADDDRQTGRVLRARLSGDSSYCGRVEQDVPGTAQGAWSEAGIPATGDESSRLGLLFENRPGSAPVFSVGRTVPGVESGVYRFAPRPEGSAINQPFDRVRPGRVYCYEGLIRRRAGTPLGRVVLLQMPDERHLRVEVVHRSDCVGVETWGALSTALPAVDFER